MEVVVKMQGSSPAPSPSLSNSTSSAAPTEAGGEGETLMLGRFVMVCRDSQTNKARKVPPLLVETEEEKMLWNIGDGRLFHQQRMTQRC